MGKKAKKKTRPPLKEKHSENVPQQSNPSDDKVEAVKEKKSCVHFNKAVDLDKVLAKIKSTESIKCEECREGVHERRGGKGKGKPGKKKGSASLAPRSESKAIWVCLECGLYACGGAGLPTGAQSHVVRHIRQTRHRLVIQWENPHLRWCFPCSAILPVEKEENGESKDVLSEVVKLINGRSLNSTPSADTEDILSGSGSLTSQIKSEGTVSGGIDARDGYVVQGLVNLGNTCFFNSILQNLLALDRLRDHFLNDSICGEGPINCSLKKLFAETKPEVGLKNVINPRSFFGSVCSKAPQFKGYQQHDSHELLRCLLDGLSSEESSLRKKLSTSNADGNPVNQTPTLIDTVFGGEISSTVSCMECGHSSKVYEPFLDLSLPVPSKKSPPKKPQTVSRAKKTKLPPKRVAKTRSKANKDANSLLPNDKDTDSMAPNNKDKESMPPNPILEQPSSSLTGYAVASDESATSGGFTLTIENNEMLVNEQVYESTASSNKAPEHACSWMDYLGPGNSSEENDLDLQDNDIPLTTEDNRSDPVSKNPADTPVQSTVEQASDMTWLDILGEATIQDESDLASQSNDAAFVSESKDMSLNGNPIENNQVNSVGGEPDLGHSSSVNPWEEELPLQVQDSQVLYMPYKEESLTAYEVERGEAEASSTILSGGKQELDFDGFGDLFNEPENSEGPVFGPPSGAEVAEAGLMAVSCSSSDHDEIDDTDSPVSIESCLAHFIKPEILSNDNAWHCENCSKNLKLQRLREKKKAKMASVMAKHADGVIKDNNVSLVLHNGKCDSLNKNSVNLENGQLGEPSLVFPNCNEEKNKMEAGVSGDSHTSSSSKETPSSSSAVADLNVTGKPTLRKQERNSQLAESSDSEGSEDEEINSENVTVKRDATKRVLINKAPPILTVHLKRFSQDARGRLSKLNGHIIFREFVDLRQYMDPRGDEGERHIYRLVGVVEHSGTMRGGHYVAYIRGGRKTRRDSDKENHNSTWYYASDAYVRQVSFEEVSGCEAYILFYERI